MCIPKKVCARTRALVVEAFGGVIVSWVIFVAGGAVFCFCPMRADQARRSRARWINVMWSALPTLVISQTLSSLLFDSGIMENHSVSLAITPQPHSSQPIRGSSREENLLTRSIFQEGHKSMVKCTIQTLFHLASDWHHRQRFSLTSEIKIFKITAKAPKANKYRLIEWFYCCQQAKTITHSSICVTHSSDTIPHISLSANWMFE